jgi:hypothetical protein
MDMTPTKALPGAAPPTPTAQLSTTTSLVQDWELLNPRNQRLARTLIETLLKEQQNGDAVQPDC